MTTFEPPFIADLISYLLLIILVYLFIYSIDLRKRFNRKLKTEEEIPKKRVSYEEEIDQNSNEKKDEDEKSAPNEKKTPQIFIEPSPIPDQKIPFPSIFQDPELTLSVVVPVANMEFQILALLHSILSFFNEKKMRNPDFSFEIIIIDCLSTDETYNITYEFALSNPEIRILKIPFVVSFNAAVLAGLTRTRGKYIFLYLPFEKIPIEQYNQFEEMIESSAYNNNEYVIVGCYDYKKEKEMETTYYRTLLSQFLEYITNYLTLLFIDIDETICYHYNSFICTREAGRIIFNTIKIPGMAFYEELIVIADKAKIPLIPVQISSEISPTYLISSLSRLDTFVALLQSLFFYKTEIWSVNNKKSQ